ncbi:hypothetical protein ACFYWN_45885, partial [Streptomyces sp. NPDC002917]
RVHAEAVPKLHADHYTLWFMSPRWNPNPDVRTGRHVVYNLHAHLVFVTNEIAGAVASAPVVAQLRTLDLSNGTLGDEGAAALLEGQPLTHLERLDLHHHFLTEPIERRIKEALEPHGVQVDLSEREVPWGDRGIEGRYTTVAE